MSLISPLAMLIIMVILLLIPMLIAMGIHAYQEKVIFKVVKKAYKIIFITLAIIGFLGILYQIILLQTIK